MWTVPSANKGPLVLGTGHKGFRDLWSDPVSSTVHDWCRLFRVTDEQSFRWSRDRTGGVRTGVGSEAESSVPEPVAPVRRGYEGTVSSLGKDCWYFRPLEGCRYKRDTESKVIGTEGEKDPPTVLDRSIYSSRGVETPSLKSLLSGVGTHQSFGKESVGRSRDPPVQWTDLSRSTVCPFGGSRLDCVGGGRKDRVKESDRRVPFGKEESLRCSSSVSSYTGGPSFLFFREIRVKCPSTAPVTIWVFPL